MKILYKNNNMEKLFNDLRDHSKNKKKLQQLVSMDILRSLKKRIDQLSASPNFYFLIDKHIGKCEALDGQMKQKFSLHVSSNVRLIISPNCDDLNKNSLQQCDELYIEGVVDYHGSKQKWIIS